MNEYLRTKIKVLSFFLVVLVVIVHSYNTNLQTEPEGLYAISGLNGFIQEFFCQGINRIASPLFFIISGFLFYVNLTGQVADFRRKVKKRFFTLIIPYLFWSLWGLLFYLVLQAVLPPGITFAKGHIMDYDFGKLMNTIFLDPIPYQLWYVRDLTVFAMLSPLLYLLLKYTKYFLVLFFFAMWFYDFQFIIFRSQSAFFFIFGAYISHQNGEILNHRSKTAASIFTSLWFLLTGVKTALLYSGYQNLQVITVLHKISIMAGILSVNNVYNLLFSTSEEIIKTKFFRIVSFSFFLFASHEPITTVIKKGLFWVLGNGGELESFLIFIVTPALTIPVCIFAGYYLKRLLPNFYGTVTGWR